MLTVSSSLTRRRSLKKMVGRFTLASDNYYGFIMDKAHVTLMYKLSELVIGYKLLFEYYLRSATVYSAYICVRVQLSQNSVVQE